MSESSASATARVDVAVFGGGVAGLFVLHALRAAGLDTVLLETRALGHGQSIQSQGIIHGGGKYALRSVADVDSMRAIRDMPDRWRRFLDGSEAPDLRGARALSPECWLWIPRASFRSRLEAWGLLPMLRHAGVLACPPRPRPKSDWPSPLRACALKAYAMAEPVLDTASVLAALSETHHEHLLHVDPAHPARFERGDGQEVSRIRVRPRGASQDLELNVGAVVFAAGEGNAALLDAVGAESSLMQRRPLRMFLLRGMASALHGHCISGGRTRMTVTSQPAGDAYVWQLGGEIAEREAEREPGPDQRSRVRRELEAVLPGLDLAGCELASYRAVRAEGHHPEHRRPSGVQWYPVRPNVVVAWPTKWALAPLLADDVAADLPARVRGGEGAPAERDRWPRPPVARPPWEADAPGEPEREIEWNAVP